MQKKLSILSLVTLVFLLSSSGANAQTASPAATSLKDQMQLLRNQKQAKLNLKQQIKDAVAAKRLEMKAAIEAKKEEFKAKLQTIRDEKKKALVERIDTKLSNVNTKPTDRFAQVLNNLQVILDKMSKDLDKTKAQAAIDAALTSVKNQAAKTYAITISTETALRSDVGAVASQLRQDLVATHKAVVDAKQAVQSLRKDKAGIKKEATSSANL